MKTNTLTQHTPGPWTDLEGFVTARFSDGQMHDVCDPRCAPIELRAEMDANARLIAAAPELLTALRETADQLEDLIEATEGLAGLDEFQRDALANSRVVLRIVAARAIAKARAAIAKAEGKT